MILDDGGMFPLLGLTAPEIGPLAMFYAASINLLFVLSRFPRAFLRHSSPATTCFRQAGRFVDSKRLIEKQTGNLVANGYMQ